MRAEKSGSAKKVYVVMARLQDYIRPLGAGAYDHDEYLRHGAQKFTSTFHEKVLFCFEV